MMSCQDSTPKYGRVWASAPTTFGWRIGKSGEPPQTRFQLGNIVPGVFTPVLAKHTKSFNLVDTLSVGVDRIQRDFEPKHLIQWLLFHKRRNVNRTQRGGDRYD